MPRGPLAPPPCAPGAPLCCGVCVCAGTVPEMVVLLSVSPPEADATPDSFEIEITFVAGKLIWVLRKDVRVNFAPAFRLPKSTRWSPFSFWSSARSLAESCVVPPFELELIVIGRVTVMSVPTPVSGFSTVACARSRPADRALTVITSAMPSPSPRAVRNVRPFRRRSSDSM